MSFASNAALGSASAADDECRLDRQCPGYLRCLDRVCSDPPGLYGRADSQTPRVEFLSDQTLRHGFYVELAVDEAARARGLSHRPFLASGWGMLFVFPRSVRNSFTMMLMHFPLDLVFVGGDGTVVDIAANAQPKTRIIRSSATYRYVLELNAGAARASGIRVGDVMTLKGMPGHDMPSGQ